MSDLNFKKEITGTMDQAVKKTEEALKAEGFGVLTRIDFDKKMKETGFDGIILFGKPGEQLLGVPVTAGRVGLVVLGGLNPVTALEEAEIPTESHAMATLADYLELSAVQAYEREWLGTIGVEKAELFERLWKERLARSPNYWSVFDALKQSTA